MYVLCVWILFRNASSHSCFRVAVAVVAVVVVVVSAAAVVVVVIVVVMHRVSKEGVFKYIRICRCVPGFVFWF